MSLSTGMFRVFVRSRSVARCGTAAASVCGGVGRNCRVASADIPFSHSDTPSHFHDFNTYRSSERRSYTNTGIS